MTLQKHKCNSFRSPQFKVKRQTVAWKEADQDLSSAKYHLSGASICYRCFLWQKCNGLKICTQYSSWAFSHDAAQKFKKLMDCIVSYLSSKEKLRIKDRGTRYPRRLRSINFTQLNATNSIFAWYAHDSMESRLRIDFSLAQMSVQLNRSSTPTGVPGMLVGKDISADDIQVLSIAVLIDRETGYSKNPKRRTVYIIFWP